jgi:hypothetical protein
MCSKSQTEISPARIGCATKIADHDYSGGQPAWAVAGVRDDDVKPGGRQNGYNDCFSELVPWSVVE